MLVAYRLVGLSALEAHYASIDASSQSAWARTLCPSFAGRTQEAPDALKGTQLTGRLKGLAVPFQVLPNGLIVYSQLLNGDMLDHGVDRPTGRHAGPALPASTSSLVQRGSAVMPKPPRPENLPASALAP